MKHYELYMNRQEVSAQTHGKLLELGNETQRKRPSNRWKGMTALAACCALVLGIGLWKGGGQGSEGVFSGLEPIDWDNIVSVSSGEHSAAAEEVIYLPKIFYQDVTSAMESAASIALPEGSFRRELTQEQIIRLFGGENLPGLLFWGNYELSGYVIYDGSGRMFWLTVYGTHPDGWTFELELAPDRLPPNCLAEPGLKTSEVMGAEVTGWSRVYDRNGDDVTDYICGSEFMAGNIGVRFENVGGEPVSGGDPMEAAVSLNACLVRQVLAEDGGLTIDHVMQAENVPEWRSAEFESLAQARQEPEFAPYLPTENISGYGEFYGRLTYQEDSENTLFVRWSHSYDDVEVVVYRPEGEPWWGETVDVTNPASYDTRMYEIPWYSSVPEEYQDSFYTTDFRAEDMSLAVVEARGTQKDTGGMSYRFGVLHEDSTLVKYSCDGLTAQQVWALVEATLVKT